MSGIAIGWGSASPGVYQVGTWIKFANLPSAPTALCDLRAGSTGQATLGWWPDGQFMVDITTNGTRVFKTLVPTKTVHVGEWWWVAMMWGHDIPGGHIGIGGQVWGPGSITDGPQQDLSIAIPAAVSADTAFGWGVGISTGYASLSNETGTELADCWLQRIVDDNFNLSHILTPPGSEPSANSLTVGLWPCHEPVGAETTLHDASSNHYDLTAGPNGAYIVRDSPY